MTENLKCPFCGSELENACAQVIYFCANDECNKAKDWYASKQVWQALIDGKKARDALKEIAQHDINEQRGELKSYVIGYQEIKELAIAAITEQEE